MKETNVPIKYQKVYKLIEQHQRISIITHLNPDGDAVGSALGLYHFLENKNKEANVMLPNDFPGFLKWLPGSDSIFIYEKHGKQVTKALKAAELIICLDFNALNRMEVLADTFTRSNAPKVLIDHHPMPENFADITISTTAVSSTAELLYRFLEATAPEGITLPVATALFTGILTDTGSFSYNASNPGTYRVVGQLIEYGINKDEINALVYDNYSVERMRLMGYCLNEKMEVFPEYHAAFIPLSLETMERFNFRTGDSEGFVNLPLSINGIIFTALFTERKKITKASFRSKGSFNVNDFARSHFSGGGHLNASGGYTEVSLEETLAYFRKLLPKLQPKLKVAADELGGQFIRR